MLQGGGGHDASWEDQLIHPAQGGQTPPVAASASPGLITNDTFCVLPRGTSAPLVFLLTLGRLGQYPTPAQDHSVELWNGGIVGSFPPQQ